MKIGDVISSFRKKKNIEQKDLAKALRVTATYMNLIENNKKSPGNALLKRAANYFGVPVSTFLFNALKDSAFKSKKTQQIFKDAEPVINALIDFLLSDDESLMIKTSRSKKKQ